MERSGRIVRFLFARLFTHWNYRKLLDYTKSQTYPVRGHVKKGNRINEQFACVSCGYSQDADYIGSINIVIRFIIGQDGADSKAMRVLRNSIQKATIIPNISIQR